MSKMRDAEEWVKAALIEDMSGDFLYDIDLIRAIQRDALEAAAKECEERADAHLAADWPSKADAVRGAASAVRALPVTGETT